LLACGFFVRHIFRTFQNLSLWPRLGFWALVVAVSMIVGRTSRVAVCHWIAPRRLRDENVLAVLAFTVIFAPLLWGMVLVLEYPRPPELSFLALSGVVLLIAVAVGLIRAIILGQFPGSDAAQGPALLARLEPTVRGGIQILTARDHYVDVVTENGTEALFMRFADAIAEVDGVDGVQVHRSHWVARNAVTAQVRRDGRLFLQMQSGAEVPVSRKYRPEVERAGLG